MPLTISEQSTKTPSTEFTTETKSSQQRPEFTTETKASHSDEGFTRTKKGRSDLDGPFGVLGDRRWLLTLEFTHLYLRTRAVHLLRTRTCVAANVDLRRCEHAVHSQAVAAVVRDLVS